VTWKRFNRDTFDEGRIICDAGSRQLVTSTANVVRVRWPNQNARTDPYV
jgi:hypothetical protein